MNEMALPLINKNSTFIHDNAERIFHEKYTGGDIGSPNS